MENLAKPLIDLKLLKQFAHGIALICNGEYGTTYYNEQECHVHVCLGDSNPFDRDDLENWIKYGITNDYEDRIDVTVDAEVVVDNSKGDWKRYNPETKEFEEFFD